MGSSRRRWPWLAAIAAISAVSVGSFATWAALRNPAERHLNEVSVAGYTRVTQVSDKSGAGPWAEAMFIGPPVDDVRSLVAAPGLSLGPAPIPLVDESEKSAQTAGTLYRSTWEGYGNTADDCRLSVYRGIDNAYDESKLTKAQVADANDGSIFVLRVHVTCGSG
ncbi:hypothetical protein ACWZHB_27120 [Nocardia sp. FBN12]|uniref:hypothetical protein n=1 Tax=Nocardia sp. FBN12 TaxID=3419766 RepID=UPI003D03C139